MRGVTWSDFYLTSAAAAATLLGLLFVAVQFNLERLPADRSQQWLAIARSTWIIFATLFFTALIYLIPTFVGQGRVLGTAIVIVVSGRRIVSAWLPVRQAGPDRKAAGLARTLWVMVGPLVLFALLLGYTIALARGASSQYGVATVIIGLFGLALRNSWELLVELPLAANAETPEPEEHHDPAPATPTPPSPTP
jgi:hypothetical protein